MQRLTHKYKITVSAFGLLYLFLFFASSIAYASELKLKVLSGNGDLRSAREMAKRLDALGYEVAAVDLAPKSNFVQHTIYFSENFLQQAEEMANRLGENQAVLKPLSWPSAFDIIFVAVAPQRRFDLPEKTRADSGAEAKNQALRLKKEAGALLSEAHTLYLRQDFYTAAIRYDQISRIIKEFEKLCKTSAARTLSGTANGPEKSSPPEKDKNSVRIQVLSKATDLRPARDAARQIEKLGYDILSVDYALRSDVENNTLYFMDQFHAQASEIVLGLEDDPAMTPLRWSSNYDLILVTGEPPDPEKETSDLSRLNAEEKRLTEKMGLALNDAHLLFENGDYAYSLKKCGEMARLVKKAENLCEKSLKQAKMNDRMKPPGMKAENKPAVDAPKTHLSLDEALRVAMARNALVQESDEKIKSAVEEKKSARADFFPKAEAVYSYTRLSEPPTTSFSNPFKSFIPGDTLSFTVGNQDNYKWNATLSQPLFTGFALSSQYRLKDLKINSAEIEKDMTILDLTRDVKKSYFNLLLAQKVLTVAEDAVKNLESHEKDAENYYKQGMIPYNDLLKSQVALANAVQQMEKVKAGVQIATAALNTLLDYDVNQDTQVEEVSAPQTAGIFHIEDLFHEAMENRPELKLLNLAVKNIDQGIRLVKSSYYPKIGLAGYYEQTGDNPAATHNDFGSIFTSAMILKADWVLFEGGKTRADVARFQHEKKAVMKRFDNAENAVKLDVKNAYSNLEVSDKNIVTSQKALTQARENWRITNLQYKEQIATSTDVLDARTFLSQAETNYYSALYGYLIALSDLERAVGKKSIY